MLFADSFPPKQVLQRLINKFSHACHIFSSAFSQKKMHIMGQATPEHPLICVKGEELLHQSKYMGSIASETLPLDVELNKRIGKASTTLARLTKKVWENKHLTTPTKIIIYKASFLSTMVVNLGPHTPTRNGILKCFIYAVSGGSLAELPSTFTLLDQRPLRWLGHIHRKENGRIPKDLFCVELATGARHRGLPQLCYKDLRKRDTIACHVNQSWEATASDRNFWKQPSRWPQRGGVAIQQSN